MADFDPFGENPQQQIEEDPAADFLAREQDQFAELEDENFGVDTSGADQTQDTYAALATDGGDVLGLETQVQEEVQEASAPSDVYSSITAFDKERAEPEKIRLWREAQTERLTKKDAESEQKNEELRAAAAKELEDWYKHQAEQLEKTKKNNREAEESFVKERDESIPGHEFERVCRLCEFNPKGAAKTQKDVSRMRSILLQLKQTPLVR